MLARICAVGVCLLVWNGICAAQTQPGIFSRFSLHLQNAPLREALEQISRQTGMPVVFADYLVENIRVSYDCASCALEEASSAILKNTRLAYLITPAAQIVLMSEKPASKQRGAVKGFVKDAANGETLPYVNVMAEGTSLGDAADEKGRKSPIFVLAIAPRL